MALVDYFLKIDGVPGESTDAKHKGEIEVDAFSWGVVHTVSGGGAGGGGRTQFQDFHFTTSVNKSSPLLLQRCASGQHLKQAVLTARKAGDKPLEFLHIKLTDVLVSSYDDQGGDLGSVVVVAPPTDTIGGTIGGAGQVPGSGLPTDDVALRYRTAQVSTTATTVGIPPSRAAMLRFNPATNKFEMVDAPGGVFTVGSQGGVISRAAMEFDIASLIGLLTSPFSPTTLRLSINEYPPGPPNASLGPPTSVAALGVAPSLHNGPRPHIFDVILYTPADGTLTVDDLTRPGTRIGMLIVDSNGDPASLDIDLTPLVRHRHLRSFGIRIQLRGTRLPDLHEDKDDEKDDDKAGKDDKDRDSDRADGPNDDRAHADDGHRNDHRNDHKNDEKDDDDKKRTPPPDFSASFTANLVLDTA